MTKQKRKSCNIRLAVAAVLILCGSILHGTAGVASAQEEEESSSSTQIVLSENGQETSYEVPPLKVSYQGTTYDCNVPSVTIGSIVYVPADAFFAQILGCSYQYSAQEDSITLKSCGRETTISFTVGSANALVNETTVTMEAPVLPVTVTDTADSDYLIPLTSVIDYLEFSVTVGEQEGYTLLEVSSNYLYYAVADSVSYDEQLYENALGSFFVKQNASGKKNIIRGITCNAADADAVSITADETSYSVTIQLLKTYNPFGEVTVPVKNGITKEVALWETEEYTTCIRVTYNKKYVYTSKITANGGKITLSKGTFSIKALLPEDVSFADLTTTDRYWNRRFFIILPGDYTEFYQTYQPVKNSTDVKKITVSTTSDGDTKLIVKTNGLKGYKLTEADGYFTVQVGEPKDIYENIVLLDAGHGGKDSGAVSGSLLEKDLNLKIVYTLLKSYFESSDSPVKAYWTRHDDTFINLYERPELSAVYQADLFVSLHMNSATTSAANGTEVYYSNLNNSGSFSGITSKLFAKKMKNTLVSALNTKDRGVKQAGFVVLKYNTVPSILIELGFITGSSDKARLQRTAFQKKAAESIYEGICAVFEKYPTGR